MGASELDGILTFLRSAERLKDTLRSSHTSSGRPESVGNTRGGCARWPYCCGTNFRRSIFPS